jgi:hypothetical protein
LDTTNARSDHDDLTIDWGAPDEDGAPGPEPALTLPPDLFQPGDPHLVGAEPAGVPLEEPSPFVLDELFGEAPEQPTVAVAPSAGAAVVVEDLFSTPSTDIETRPRLAPERTGPAPTKRRPKLPGRKLWMAGAVVAGVVALSAVLNQPPDPSVDVRSAAAPAPAPTVPATTRPLPSTTSPPSGTTVATAPSTTTAPEVPGGTGLTSAGPATTVGAAPRVAIAPTPATTAAPPSQPPSPPPAPPTSTATTQPEPDPVTTEPSPPETTVTTRRTRETIPPPTTTTTTVEPEEVVEVD